MNQKVTVIPAKEPAQSGNGSTAGCKRVAAYCRVSTDSLEQINSYNAQKTITRSTLQHAQIGSW